MDEIERLTWELLEAIRASEIYTDFRIQEDRLSADPEVFKRVTNFRADNFRFQQDISGEELFSLVEKLDFESSELRKKPEVNAYLEAELALCRLLQKVCRTLTEGIEITIPEKQG
ncbi:MAG: YlbF family regulator [Blautia sp.]|nr:YlbF family regulator [Blautia sp.]